MLLEDDEIRMLIADKLYASDIINDEIYEKCGKPHISSLPGDLRTNDKVKLDERKNEIKSRIKESNNTIMKLKKSENNFKKMLNDESETLKKKVDEFNDNLDNLFTDYFGEPGTDKPENVIRDIREGLEDNKTANEYEKWMKDINKFSEEYNKFQKKMNTALDKKKNPDNIIKLMKGFKKKYNKFFDKYYKFHDKHGNGGYNDNMNASQAMRRLSGFLDTGQSGRFSNLEGYTNTYNLLNETKVNLKKERSILKDYKDELKRVNSK